VEVPPALKAIAGGKITQTLETIDTLASVSTFLGIDTAKLPGKSEVGAIRKMYTGVEIPKLAVCYFDDSEWKLIATIKPEFERADVEGFGRVVGKVVSALPTGSTKPLLTMKGMSFLNRQQRRELERTTITDKNRDQFIEGPALVIDLLAIYR
jgi:hypothetical protein